MSIDFPIEEPTNEGISFYSEDRDVPEYIIQNRDRVIRWIHEIADDHDCSIRTLHVHFCSDEALLHMNRKFLDHDYYTDILTFPASGQARDVLSGELYISRDRLEDHADEFECDLISESLRVIIHGVLHLAGYGDESEEEQKNMLKLEDQALSSYHSIENS